MAARWIGVGSSYPSAVSAARSRSSSPRVENPAEDREFSVRGVMQGNLPGQRAGALAVATPHAAISSRTEPTCPLETPMAPTFPSVDTATLKALRKGDTSALEKIHRAAYAAVIADAGRQGGDPSIGPPVAELAMLTAVEGRANIETAEELEEAIHAAVRGGVTREQRRRAANKEGSQAVAGARRTRPGRTSRPRSRRRRRRPRARKHTRPKHHVEKAKSDGGRGGMIAVGVLLLLGAGVRRLVRDAVRARTASRRRPTPCPDAKPVSVRAPASARNLPLGPGDTAAIGSDTQDHRRRRLRHEGSRGAGGRQRATSSSRAARASR